MELDGRYLHEAKTLEDLQSWGKENNKLFIGLWDDKEVHSCHEFDMEKHMLMGNWTPGPVPELQSWSSRGEKIISRAFMEIRVGSEWLTLWGPEKKQMQKLFSEVL